MVLTSRLPACLPACTLEFKLLVKHSLLLLGETPCFSKWLSCPRSCPGRDWPLFLCKGLVASQVQLRHLGL